MKSLEVEARGEAIAGMKKSFDQATSGGVIFTAVISKIASLAMEAFDAMNQLTNTFGTDDFSGKCNCYNGNSKVWRHS